MKKTAFLLLAAALILTLLLSSCTIEIHNSFEEEQSVETSSQRWEEESAETSSWETSGESVQESESEWTEQSSSEQGEEIENRVSYLIHTFYGAFGLREFSDPGALPRESALNFYLVMNSSIEGPEPGKKEVKAEALSAFLAQYFYPADRLVFRDEQSEKDGWTFDEEKGVYRNEHYQPGSLSVSTELAVEKIVRDGDQMRASVRIATLEAGVKKQMEFLFCIDQGEWKLCSAKRIG